MGKTEVVWGGTAQARYGIVLPGARPHNRQARVIVRAKTKKRAVELINASVFGPSASMHWFNTYWAETGNDQELSVATHEGVWYRPLDVHRIGNYLVAPLRHSEAEAELLDEIKATDGMECPREMWPAAEALVARGQITLGQARGPSGDWRRAELVSTNKPVPRICDTCPWRVVNHGKPHAAGWYKLSNLKKLWAGLRSGRAPGMICHSTDPKNVDYGGSAPVKPGHEAECGGALYLMIRNMNAVAKGQPQPIQPPLAKRAMAQMLEQHLFGGGLGVMPPENESDIGVPWMKETVE